MGRISKVLEPDNPGALGLETDYLYYQNVSPGSGSTYTSYQHIINQKGGSSSSADWRTRTLTFDMLGRVKSETAPEAGTISYTYPNGTGSCAGDITLTCGRTDANGTSTTYSYDAVNRLTGKSYGGSSIGTATPSISYYYDQAVYNGLSITNGNGMQTGMSDASGSTAWSFDGMGRVVAIRKTINGITGQANYAYNADGSTDTAQDFGGTTFTWGYDVAGRPTSIVDGYSNTYASGATYNAAGQLTSLNHQLTPSGGAYVRSIQYNNRLQPSVISATLNGSTIQSLAYGYGTGGMNNGNVSGITNGMDSSRSQTYSYDSMNRLISGRDTSHWGETYTYDYWGNLTQTQQMSGLAGNNWAVTANGNNQLSNLLYDSAGEVTTDQYGNSFSYDAEGRILSGGGGTYVYDGGGNRVKKTVGSTTTLYWPGTSGLLNESNSSGSTTGKHVQFAGLLVYHEDASGTGSFLFHDHLRSVRITGTPSGTLADDIDYQSYGNLLQYGSSLSNNHYFFTGDEADAETSSDYATFRNLGTTMGRFNRPDPYDGSYYIINPQSLNRYSYAMNNPLAFTDSSGMYCTVASGPGGYNSTTGTIGAWQDASTESGCLALNGYWIPNDQVDNCTQNTGSSCTVTVTIPDWNLGIFGQNGPGSQDGFADCDCLAGEIFHGAGAQQTWGNAYAGTLQAGGGYLLAVGGAAAAPVIAATGTAISSAISGEGLFGAAAGRIFWSGGIAAGVQAANYAEGTGGVTLEMTPVGQWLTSVAPNSSLLWNAASRSFASGAYGPVTVFQGDYLRLGNAWAAQEYPILSQANPINYVSTGRW